MTVFDECSLRIPGRELAELLRDRASKYAAAAMEQTAASGELPLTPAPANGDGGSFTYATGGAYVVATVGGAAKISYLRKANSLRFYADHVVEDAFYDLLPRELAELELVGALNG